MAQKIAFITGGSRGLGRSTALALAERGHDVIFTFHKAEDEAKKVVTEIKERGRKAHALKLDTGSVKSFPAFRDEFTQVLKSWNAERFHSLVNNAGVGLYKPILETTEDDFDNLMNIHFKGVYFLTQTLLPLLADGGRIINLSSGLARFSYPGSSAYASMKGAIEVFTRYLAKELGSRGITANTVAPGAIETDFGGGRVRDNKDINQGIASQTPLGRVGLPEDIGPAIAALLSDDCRWMNAQRIELSGGIHL